MVYSQASAATNQTSTRSWLPEGLFKNTTHGDADPRSPARRISVRTWWWSYHGMEIAMASCNCASNHFAQKLCPGKHDPFIPGCPELRVIFMDGCRVHHYADSRLSSHNALCPPHSCPLLQDALQGCLMGNRSRIRKIPHPGCDFARPPKLTPDPDKVGATFWLIKIYLIQSINPSPVPVTYIFPHKISLPIVKNP